MRASLAAIHYHATRPTCPTTVAMDALLLTIRDECERCIPDLKRVRPPNVAGGSPTFEHVLKFAERMESKLAMNRHKGDRAGWLNASPEILMHRLKEELKELEDAFWTGDANATADECADVANFAMMIADWFITRATLPESENVAGELRPPRDNTDERYEKKHTKTESRGGR